MYKHLLVCTDGSDLSHKAIDEGVRLARYLGAELTAVYAVANYVPPVEAIAPIYYLPTLEEYQERAKVEAEHVLAQVRQTSDEAGIPCELEWALSDDPYRLILDVAERRGCDLVVMASHGRRGLSGLILGSETTRVLTHSKVPVLVVR
ncbi:MAG: universal stress protein [Lysobacterales bacterium]